MPEPTKDDAAKTGGGLTKEDVAALLAPVTQLITAQAETIKALQGDQKILADTLAKLPPAQAGGDDKAAKDAKEKKDAAAVPPTAEEIKKLIADGIAATQQQQQQSAELAAKRKAFVESDASGLKRLPSQFTAGLGNDPAKWADEAKAVKDSWESFARDNKITLPDVAAPGKDGGQSAARSGQASEPNTGNLSPGLAAYAKEIKLPAA